MSDQTEKLVRFQRPERSLPYLPGLDPARIAPLFGLTADDYAALCRAFDDEARWAAAALLDDTEVAAAVDRLPLRPGQHVVALGESSTADRMSWFEILRHLLDLRRPRDEITLTNLAVSGATTTQTLNLLPALHFQRPDLVVCQLGANDAQRIGGLDGPRLVGLAEAERNLRILRANSAAEWIWLTPTAIDESRVAAFAPFRRVDIAWAAADIAATAEILRELPDLTVDVEHETMPPGEEPLLLDDGVHASAAGQQAVAASFVAALS
ncbi:MULTISPECIES: SGNH/GDSL hydrolase family protein [unclassified Nocardia]|uniref:SGNH/GDSL hydrolase family protein n=1 Tax=unclassified Nocardia TaxID=2637762 RepID=UPI0033A0DE57